MSENWWEGVANAFVTHYYTQFDAGVETRVQLAALYVRLYHRRSLPFPSTCIEKFCLLLFRACSLVPLAKESFGKQINSC